MSDFYDLIVRGATLVGSDGLAVADVAISEGRFVKVERDLPGDAREVIKGTGMHLIAGIIDSHVHFNEPGRADWEGIETGSNALAAGGGTSFFDMPLNSLPRSRTRQASRRSARQGNACRGPILPSGAA